MAGRGSGGGRSESSGDPRGGVDPTCSIWPHAHLTEPARPLGLALERPQCGQANVTPTLSGRRRSEATPKGGWEDRRRAGSRRLPHLSSDGGKGSGPWQALLGTRKRTLGNARWRQGRGIERARDRPGSRCFGGLTARFARFSRRARPGFCRSPTVNCAPRAHRAGDGRARRGGSRGRQAPLERRAGCAGTGGRAPPLRAVAGQAGAEGGSP